MKGTNADPGPAALARPTTLPEAEERMWPRLMDSDKDLLAWMGDARHLPMHDTFAVAISAHCGLWEGNPALLESCGTMDPDEAAQVILGELIRRVKRERA